MRVGDPRCVRQLVLRRDDRDLRRKGEASKARRAKAERAKVDRARSTCGGLGWFRRRHVVGDEASAAAIP